MTVKELRAKLSGLDDRMRVVVYAEDENGRMYEIDDVSTAAGTPSRLNDGKAAFEFEKNETVSWLFISVSAA